MNFSTQGEGQVYSEESKPSSFGGLAELCYPLGMT